jgi:hypothetical protein
VGPLLLEIVRAVGPLLVGPLLVEFKALVPFLFGDRAFSPLLVGPSLVEIVPLTLS